MIRRIESKVNYALSGGLLSTPLFVPEANATSSLVESPFGLHTLEILAMYATPLLPVVGVILGLAQLYRTFTRKRSNDDEK